MKQTVKLTESELKHMIAESVKLALNEDGFKKGQSLVIPGNREFGRKIIRMKYGIDPDDFEYVGGGKFVYKLKDSNTSRRSAQPKKKKEFLGRKEGETEQDYLERVREINPNFAEVEKELPGEEWRPIKNTGRYFGGESDYSRTHEISNMGRIRTIDFNDPMRSRISTGYDAPTRNARQFHLDTHDENGTAQKTTPPIHTMVADAWLEPPEGNIEDYDVEHIDKNYHNNRADNLRYVLRKGRRGRKANNNIETIHDNTPQIAENKENNKNKNMKQTVKLTESELRHLISESVRKALNEGTTDERDIENWDRAKEMLGADTMLDAFMSYMNCDQIHQLLEWLNDDYELGFDNEEEDF